jgi:hypothetical protein
LVFLKVFFMGFKNLCGCKGTTNIWNTQEKKVFLSDFIKKILHICKICCTFAPENTTTHRLKHQKIYRYEKNFLLIGN